MGVMARAWAWAGGEGGASGLVGVGWAVAGLYLEQSRLDLRDLDLEIGAELRDVSLEDVPRCGLGPMERLVRRVERATERCVAAPRDALAAQVARVRLGCDARSLPALVVPGSGLGVGVG